MTVLSLTVKTIRPEVAKRALGQDSRALYVPIDLELYENQPRMQGLGRSQRLPIAFVSE